MKERRPVIGVVMVFLLGILCGSLATHLLYSYRFDSLGRGRGGAREEVVVNRLERRLGLDERQLQQVRAIVHETHEGITALHSQMRPQMDELIEKAQTRINAILTQEQQAKFAKMIAERKERMREKEH
ncbi:MAG TPA: hypothetical protein VMJ66_01770 [Geobacteraceae bacterium]|nr:hypothetical protein [Geobacteraceae bacterium]